MGKKKILFLISTLQFGGAEKQTIDLVNHLDSSKIKINLCYLLRDAPLKDTINENQISGLHCLDKKSKIDFSVFRRLRKIIKLTQPDVVVCVDPYPGLYAHMARTFSKRTFNIIQIVHSTIMPNLYDEFVTRILYRHILNRSNKVVFVCKNQMDYWISHFGISPAICQFIYNGIDTDYFNDCDLAPASLRLRSTLGIKQSDICLCISASFRPEKRHVDLIEAAKMLIEKGHSVKLLLVGDGLTRKSIEMHAKQCNMVNNLIITGFQQDVRPYILASDIVVMPSVAVETFSIAILEAMSLGKAIVASDIGGASEQIMDGENGFLFPAGNINALAEKIEIIIEKNLFQSMGKKSRSLVVEKFTTQQMVENYQRLFNSPAKIDISIDHN